MNTPKKSLLNRIVLIIYILVAILAAVVIYKYFQMPQSIRPLSKSETPSLPIITPSLNLLTTLPTQIDPPPVLSEGTSEIIDPNIDNINSTTNLITPSPTYSFTPNEDEQPWIIGYSVEGRPLEIYHFGSGDNHLLIIAGVHGGYEWNTVKLADELIKNISEDQIIIPDDVTLYILRNLNPDGLAKDDGADGRANADNVDLNRNWDANWQSNWYGAHCWSLRFITAGTGPFSEPETQALSKFILEHNIKALINYHSAALGIFPGGWPTDRNSIHLAYQLSLVTPYSYPPVDVDCQYTGQLIDWASSKGIAAVDIELRNHVDDDYLINLQALNVFLDWEKYLGE